MRSKESQPQSVWKNAVSRREFVLGLVAGTALGGASAALWAKGYVDGSQSQYVVAANNNLNALSDQVTHFKLDNALAAALEFMTVNNILLEPDPLYGFTYPSTRDTANRFIGMSQNATLVAELADDPKQNSLFVSRDSQKSQITFPYQFPQQPVADQVDTLYISYLQSQMPLTDFNDPFKKQNMPVIGEIKLSYGLKQLNHFTFGIDPRLTEAYSRALQLKVQGQPNNWESDLRSILGIH